MGPGPHIVHIVGGQQPGVPLVDGAPMQLHRVAAAADEHQFYDAGGLGQGVGAVLDAAALHGHHFDIAAYPVGRIDLQVAELDVLAGDIAAYALADRTVG